MFVTLFSSAKSFRGKCSSRISFLDELYPATHTAGNMSNEKRFNLSWSAPPTSLCYLVDEKLHCEDVSSSSRTSCWCLVRVFVVSYLVSSVVLFCQISSDDLWIHRWNLWGFCFGTPEASNVSAASENLFFQFDSLESFGAKLCDRHISERRREQLRKMATYTRKTVYCKMYCNKSNRLI